VSPKRVPFAQPGLSWAAGTEAGRAWLQQLPRLVEECEKQWSLRLGDPFPHAYASLALPATLADGDEAVLKICFPDRESEHEADALAHWNGRGAVRLLERDRERRALLVERCLPGNHLRQLAPDAALDVIVGLLPRLWVTAGEPFRTLETEAAWWASYLPEKWERSQRPFEQELLEAALEALRELVPTQGDTVLVNQDLHADNILGAEREPWLAIDPKPLLGEREFGLASVIRAPELGHSEQDVRHRLDRLTTELALDPERARGWALAQTLAWAWENDDALPRHVETARWLASARS
jgi:streptomycin 6-kinase